MKSKYDFTQKEIDFRFQALATHFMLKEGAEKTYVFDKCCEYKLLYDRNGATFFRNKYTGKFINLYIDELYKSVTKMNTKKEKRDERE